MKLDSVTIDLETYYDNELTLKKMTPEEYVNDPRFELNLIGYQVGDDAPGVYVAYGKPAADVADFLINVLRLPERALIGYNTAFDASVLAWLYGVYPAYYVDVMAMARPTIYPLTGSASLAAVAGHVMGAAKLEGLADTKCLHYRELPEVVANQLATYCRNDVWLTKQLYDALRPGVPQSEMDVIDLCMRMYVEPTLHIDRDLLVADMQAEQAEKDRLLNSLGVTLEQIRSDAKFALIYEWVVGPPPTKISPRTGKKAYAFAKTDPAMQALLVSKNEQHRKLGQLRLSAKSSIKESRSERFIGIHDRMGCLPVPLTYWGAHTGRLSGRDNINLQNLGRGSTLRKAIVAPPGYVLIAADLGQIEARFTALLAGQMDMVEAFASGQDLYVGLASQIYGVPQDEVTPEQRFIGKMGILGLGYGMGARAFHTALTQQGADVTPEFCEKVVSVYRAKYSHIKQLWRTANTLLRDCLHGGRYANAALGSGRVEGIRFSHKEVNGSVLGAISLPSGMHILYPELTTVDMPDSTEFRYKARRRQTSEWKRLYGAVIVENVVQASTRIMVTDAMTQLHRELAQFRVSVALQVHDEIVQVCPENAADLVADYTAKVMTKPPAWAPQMPLTASVKIGRTYADCK